MSSFLILWSVFRFSPIVPRHSLISIFNSFRSSFVMIDRRAANDRIAAPVPGAALKLKRNCISKLVRINRIIYSMPSSGESRPSDKGVPGYPGSDRHWDKWGRGRSGKEFFSALRASIWSKIGGGGGLAPPGLSVGSATAKSFLGFFHTTTITFAAGTKTIPDRASVQA